MGIFFKIVFSFLNACVKCVLIYKLFCQELFLNIKYKLLSKFTTTKSLKCLLHIKITIIVSFFLHMQLKKATKIMCDYYGYNHANSGC